MPSFDPKMEDVQGWAQRQVDGDARAELLASAVAALPPPAPVPAPPEPWMETVGAGRQDVLDWLCALRDALSGASPVPVEQVWMEGSALFTVPPPEPVTEMSVED